MKSEEPLPADPNERPNPTPYQHQSVRKQYWPFSGEITVGHYRAVRDRMRIEKDPETELQLREAMDSIWFRLKRSDRRILNGEFEEWLGQPEKLQESA